MEQKNIEYQYNYLPVEVFYFLVYKATKEQNFFIESAERNYKMVLRSHNREYNAGKLEIIFDDEKLTIKCIDFNDNQYDALNLEIITPLIQFLEGHKENISVEEAEAGIKEMIAKIFQQGDLYVGLALDKNRSILQLLIPVKNYITTPVIILLNIGVFVAMLIDGVSLFVPNAEFVLNWGANCRPYTLDGEWWRIITSNYLHFGIIHIAFNMYAFVYIGRTLEPMIGSFRLAVVYTLTGISGSLASLWWHDLAVSAGASGAIFGVYGFFLALLVFNYFGKDLKKQMINGMLMFIGINIFIGVAMGFDNAGHVGGAGCGFLLGYLYLPGLKRNSAALKWIGIFASLILMAGMAVYVFKFTPRDIIHYLEKKEEIKKLESEVIEIYATPYMNNPDSALNYLTLKGLPKWQKCKNLSLQIDKLKLPEELKRQNKSFIMYFDKRILLDELQCRSISENTTKYNGQIKDIEEKIDLHLKSLKKE